jgi:hypothetical protein
LFGHPVILRDDDAALVVRIGTEHQGKYRSGILQAPQPLVRRAISKTGHRIGDEEIRCVEAPAEMTGSRD